MVYGAVDEVRRRYSLPEVRVHARRPAAARCRRSRRWRPRATASGGSCWPTERAPSALLGALVRAGARIDRFEPMLAPMEEIFLRVVREGRSMIALAQDLDGRDVRVPVGGQAPGFLVVTFGMPLFIAAYAGIVAVPGLLRERVANASRRSSASSTRPALLHLQASDAIRSGRSCRKN